MALLYKQMRLHQVFGANTDVGKTLLTSALCRAQARVFEPTDGRVFYLKPVSTGRLQDADDQFVARFAGPKKHAIQVDCLYRYDEPVSPHLAAKMHLDSDPTQPEAPSTSAFLDKIKSYVHEIGRKSITPAAMYIETAGGVHSPTLSGVTQADAYRALLLPTILIGDSRLGGISSTISAFESLHMRGYTVDHVLLFQENYYRNWEYLTGWFGEKDVKVSAIQAPPSKLDDPKRDTENVEAYYRTICDEDGSPVFDVLRHLDAKHSKRLENLQSMSQRTLDSIWWPFVQHGRVKSQKDVMVIDSANGDFFSVYSQSSESEIPSPVETATSLLHPRFDGSASWWTQAVGHGHPSLTLAAANAAGRYGHVLFPQATHEPVLTLSERLLRDGPGKGWAQRAFYTDNGAAGCEVALKMALRSSFLRYRNVEKRKDLSVIGLKGSYHGDTIGAMDACEGGTYNAAVEWYRGRGFWFDPPRISVRLGTPCIFGSGDSWKKSLFDIENQDKLQWVDDTNEWQYSGLSLSGLYDVKGRLRSPLARVYRQHIRTTLETLVAEGYVFGAVMIEPLLMGAGGMVFVDPLFQRILIDVVRESEDLFAGNTSLPITSLGWNGLPVIFDEVFIGLYRLGIMTSTSILGVNPDISVLAKILTGGLLPMAVTLSSSSIFEAFLGEEKADALLHSHSYTAHPIGCAVANKALDLAETVTKGASWKGAQEKWISSELYGISGTAEVPSVWSLWDADFIETLSSVRGIQDVMTMGTVLAIRLEDSDAGYEANSADAFVSSVRKLSLPNGLGAGLFDVHARSLGNVAYFMTSLNTPPDIIRSLEAMIRVAAEDGMA